MPNAKIAIVGMACQYPDARSPQALWENALAQRQAFRRIPTNRLNLADYYESDRQASDRTYSTNAAVIEGYEFDRVNFKITGSSFRAADLTHWLALDVAARALEDAGFPKGEDLPRESTGVLLGNTLTGEFSRANTLRMRWPYVRRVVADRLRERGWSNAQLQAFLGDLEIQYKQPFPEVGDETLAGNLSNTIAGRICNYFDLKGGGYTLDGACSSSLLAVANACSALLCEDLDVALAGGVDLSLDPFELLGFAKVGALAPEEMRVYDARPAGFLPGEGCGFVVLMRYADAMAQQRPIYATIRGWGISSDGSGGITRPEVAGQLLALQRAYRRAGFGIDTVPYFEGHGTGTTVGDATELRALSRARREARADLTPAAIGSIKANIGHTKAAAGVAGLIKATMAVHGGILPPNTGCQQPHPELTGESPALRVLPEAETWSGEAPMRAGVSAMGFGGINAHLVLEGPGREPDRITLAGTVQDAELIVLGAANASQMQERVGHLLAIAPRLSRSEVTDLAAELAGTIDSQGAVRAAILASSPQELTTRLEILQSWLAEGLTDRLNLPAGICLGTGKKVGRIGFLFPGQASPVYLDDGVWGRRFPTVRELYCQTQLPTGGDRRSTALAQPSIVLAEIAGLRVLQQLGITATVAIGHSLGELTALHWAGAMDEAAALQIAKVRGQAMAELGSPTGMMASIGADAQTVKGLLPTSVVIAGFNSPHQTIISGEAKAVVAVVNSASAKGLKTTILPVSHAFHSPLVAAAAAPLAAHLAGLNFQPLQQQVVSTITGSPLQTDANIPELLFRQVTAPVRFIQAVAQAAGDVDLWLEVGPGNVLSPMITDLVRVPTVALDSGGSSLKGLLQAVGAAFAIGAPVDIKSLFAGRFTRPFNLNWQPQFLTNPCEIYSHEPASFNNLQPTTDDNLQPTTDNLQLTTDNLQPTTDKSPLECIRQLVAKRAELPLEAVRSDSRLLGDLHLNSITVSQLVTDGARSLGLSPPVNPTDYADATVGEVANALQALEPTDSGLSIVAEERSPAGVDGWIKTFTVELVEQILPPLAPRAQKPGTWQIIAPTDSPWKDAQPWENVDGNGVVVCLHPGYDTRNIDLLLAGARTVLSDPEKQKFVLVQHGGGGASFARTLHLENPQVTTIVVDLPLESANAVEWLRAEARTATGYSEAHYDEEGTRRSPVLELLPAGPESSFSLGKDDVLLVTGGGKGIAAECALTIAKATGVRLALLGRSRPERDGELASNLQRMKDSGIELLYISTDVSDREGVDRAVRKIERELGVVTAIIHGAGVNTPKLIKSLEKEDFISTLGPKVRGAENVLAAVKPEQLRLLITFGSIIARTGLPGEADYAIANEWLGQIIEKFARKYPHCHCLNLEWSVWSGVGMGERLGRVDALTNQGITPIPADTGKDILLRLLGRGKSIPSTSVVVTGRFGEPPTLKMARMAKAELPFLRFLENPRVYYPGVELVVDAELSLENDPYLRDHVFQDEYIFPAVMGLEAMAQVAIALLGSREPVTFEEVKLPRPVVVAADKPLGIRIAALVRESGKVDVVLRCEQTAFAADHFQATCCLGGQSKLGEISALPMPDPQFHVSLNPETDLYGGIFFHSGRFQRLQGYQHLRSTSCVAEIAVNNKTKWFSRYLPDRLVLGDPGARDAVIHGLQACIPQARLLPIGIEKLAIAKTGNSEMQYVCASESRREGDIFIYDLQVVGKDGSILESWSGLQLKVVGQTQVENAWKAALLAPYMERQLQELIPTTDVSIVLDADPAVDRRTRSDRALQQALGARVSISRRPDGKPEVASAWEISAAHAENLTLAVAGATGCDLEPVAVRSQQMWQDLLGKDRYQLAEMLVREVGEDLNTAATRVWTAVESLRKASAMVATPLMLTDATADGWVLLKAGSRAIGTFVASVSELSHPLVLAVLVGGKDESLSSSLKPLRDRINLMTR